MNADEARVLSASKTGVRQPIVDQLYEHVIRRITVAAQSGHRSITNPLGGMRIPTTTKEEEDEVHHRLTQLGYTVEAATVEKQTVVTW